MVKGKQKISGAFRTREDAQAVCALRSYISTVHKQGGNVILPFRLPCWGSLLCLPFKNVLSSYEYYLTSIEHFSQTVFSERIEPNCARM